LAAGPSHYIPYLKKVRETTSTPIHVQFEPPPKLSSIGKLYETGADSAGIHIETLDEEVRRKVCPGKARIGKTEYLQAWKEALNVFGENQVSTFILIGLGEDRDETVRGLEGLASLGVIPYIVPLRPLPGSGLENALPPTLEIMLQILESAATAIKEYGLKPNANKAGCVRCGACSPLMEALNYGV
jgi:radical SAM protein (TIGR04043 family)